MPRYTYSLLRYVPDPARMEPLNIGVLVQDGQTAAHRINGRFVPGRDVKPDFDRDNFREWRQFFEAEVTGEHHPLFQPPRGDPRFLDYLASKCTGTYRLTRPLALESSELPDLTSAVDYLYGALVERRRAPADRVRRPVPTFRAAVRRVKLDRCERFRHNDYIQLPDGPQVPFFYSYENEGRRLIEKVEVVPQFRYTQMELDAVDARLKQVRACSDHEFHIVILMDPPPQRPEETGASAIAERLLEHYKQRRISIGRNADQVVEDPTQAEELATSIARELRVG